MSRSRFRLALGCWLLLQGQLLLASVGHCQMQERLYGEMRGAVGVMLLASDLTPMPIPEGKAAVDIADIDLSASAGQGSTPAALASPAAMPCHDNADSATLPPTSSIPADSSGSCLNCEFSCGFVSLHPAIADSGFDMPPPLAISAPEPDALTLAGSRDRALRPPILPRTR